MKLKQSCTVNRRGFLNRIAVINACAFTSSIFSTNLLAKDDYVNFGWSNKYPTKQTYIDEALENYPSYAENIGFGRRQFVDETFNYPLNVYE